MFLYQWKFLHVKEWRRKIVTCDALPENFR